MVNILFDRYDLENKKLNEIILNQITALAKRVSPDSSFDLLRLRIGVSKITKKDC